jgi:hypothetical protein
VVADLVHQLDHQLDQDMLSLDWIILVVAVVVLLPLVLNLLEDQVEEVLLYLDTHKYLKKVIWHHFVR